MKNRVYGVVGIKSIMSNWNADFTGRPKTTSNGNIYGSDKAFKYPIKKMWENEGEKVLYIKSYKIDEKGNEDEKDKIQPRTLSERYEQIFAPAKLENSTSSKDVIKNLFTSIDVMNFGATFAVPKKKAAKKEKGEKEKSENEDKSKNQDISQNIGITGVVQVSQGYNKCSDAFVESQDILSPFRNPKKEEAAASSLGTKVFVDEAHYFYPFTVNPENYNEYIELIEGFKGYDKAAYLKFKKGCLVAATAFNTNSKIGCENEFALFIECKNDAKLYLPNLDQYIKFEKTQAKSVIDLTGLDFIAEAKEKIEKVEVYYNKAMVEIKSNLKEKGLKYEEMDIFNNDLVR
jgi:CRISPR-associated protein Csh2